MHDTHGFEDMPDLPGFAINRTGATVTIEPCFDGEHWHVIWVPNVLPEPMKVPTGYMEFGEDGRPTQVLEEHEWVPITQHYQAHAIFNVLTPEECRLFLGWLEHIHGQLGAHLTELAESVKLAVEEKRWDGVAKIAQSLHMCCQIRANIDAAGKLAFELT